MPHYYFDVTDDKVVHDLKGTRLPDIDAARAHAILLAEELVKTKSELFGEPVSAWRVTVKDSKFNKVLSVPLQGGKPEQK